MRSYFRIARVDHWGKNLFMIPGAALALGFQLSSNQYPTFDLGITFLSFLALSSISSANYTINEWLDRDFDRLHPWKNERAAVQTHMKARLVWIQWLVLAIAGLWLASFVNSFVLGFVALLLVMGLLYNVKPFRSKDVAYLDVISESVNNPIRMAIGWYTVTEAHPVPASAFIAFWGGGAFLMALKRHTEMSIVKDREKMGLYRKSFEVWTSESLLSFAVLGALLSSAFLGVLLAGYRLEYVLLLPVLVGLFHHYLTMALKQDEAAIRPEQLWSRIGLQIWVGTLVALGIILTFIDIPVLGQLVGF